MSIKLRRNALGIAIAAAIVFSSLLPAGAAEPETEVRQAAERFYEALNTMFTGEVGPMLDVWSHSDDVAYMGPFGKILVGWKEVRASWEQQAKLKLGGRVEPVGLRVVANDDFGITVGYERGTNFKNGKQVNVDIRATNVFRRENGKWKMVSHHTDLFPWVQSP